MRQQCDDLQAEREDADARVHKVEDGSDQVLVLRSYCD